MAEPIDGIYSGFFTGTEGQGLGMFVFRKGRIIGADAMGVRFDGYYEKLGDEPAIKITVTVKAPAGGYLIQGKEVGSDGYEYEVNQKVPTNFADHPYLPLQTPLGPVNVRLEKLANLED